MTISTTFTASRLNYVLQYLACRIGVKLSINKESSHIGYGTEGSIFSITDLGLLRDGTDFTTEIVRSLMSEVIEWLDNSGSNDKCPDVFSLVFWYLARIEEYKPYSGDKYSRFTSNDTICKEFGVVRRPLVDEIVHTISSKLKSGGAVVDRKVVNHLSTLDIDQPFAYAHKGRKVFLGALKDLVKGNFQNLKWRLSSFVSAYDDPYFTYEYIYDIHMKYGLKPKVFILSSYNRHPFDNNHDPEDSPYRVVINMLANQYEVGLHPSYHSSIDYNEVKAEKKRLEGIVDHEVTSSRQHFLRISMPKTYLTLLEVGIKDDYTMGFADDIGYRAGTGHPFLWYDLMAESTTTLTIHPFVIMDVTLKDYLSYDPEKALEECNRMIDRAESVYSPVTIIWHNSSLHMLGGWHGWKNVYYKLLERIAKTRME